MWISEREGDTSTGSTRPRVPDEARMNNQVSYLVSVRLILVLIHASLIPCGEVRLQRNTGKKLKECNINAIHINVNL